MKKICLFVNLLLMITLAGYAQLLKPSSAAGNNHDTLITKNNLADSLPLHLPLLLIPPNYYSTHLGFFCKRELQVQKGTKIPLQFRLGSVEYNNYMEQKPNAQKPPL